MKNNLDYIHQEKPIRKYEFSCFYFLKFEKLPIHTVFSYEGVKYLKIDKIHGAAVGFDVPIKEACKNFIGKIIVASEKDNNGIRLYSL